MTYYLVGDCAFPESNKSAVQYGKPVAVIDPEDRESVTLLNELIQIQPQSDMRPLVDVLRDALREFANPKPPKPEEPTGLGAVAKDTLGRHWVRDFAGTPGSSAWYCRAMGERRQWVLVDVAEVLTPGVPVE